MTWSVDESDFLTVAFNMKGTDFLGDTSMLFFGNVGLSEIIDKSGFAMIDMAHDGYNRRFLFHLKFLCGSEIGSIDDADDFEFLFGNDVIFGVDHLFAERGLTDV
jgi:hypothetical protein